MSDVLRFFRAALRRASMSSWAVLVAAETLLMAMPCAAQNQRGQAELSGLGVSPNGSPNVNIAREESPDGQAVFRVRVSALPGNRVLTGNPTESPAGNQALVEWLCRDVSVSPDGRLIAYTQFRAVQDPSPSAVYLVYDTSLPPDGNRMPAAEQSGPADAAGLRAPALAAPALAATGDWGRPFFPDQSRTAVPFDMSGYNEMNVHHLLSPLVWVDDKRLVFLDNAELKTSVVLVDFSPGVTASRVALRPLDEMAIVDAARLAPGVDRASAIRARSIAAIPTDTGLDVVVTLDPARARQATATVHF